MADRPRSMAGAGASPSDPDPLSSPRWLQFQDDWRPSPASSRSDGSLGPGFGHGLVASFPRASSLYDDIDKWEELEDPFDVPERTATRLVANMSLRDVRPRLPAFQDQQRSDLTWSSSLQSSQLPMRMRQSQVSGLPRFDLNLSWPGPVTSDLSRLSTSQHHMVGQLKLRRVIGTTGRKSGDFQNPHGFCIGLREEILVADTHNHRIQVFHKNGDFKHVFGVKGKEDGSLWFPRKVGVLKDSGWIVVCDRGRGRSRYYFQAKLHKVFDEAGYFLKLIPIGNIEIVSGLAITSQGNIALVDSVRPAVHILDPTHGDQLNCITLQSEILEPSDIAIFEDQFYVCDFRGHQVIHLGADGAIIGKISTEFVSKYPNGIDVSDAGDILICDSHGNSLHVAVFNNQKQFLSHYECPSIQVSRCCGLRILSDGHIVTLAKNNDNVLIMDTIYV